MFAQLVVSGIGQGSIYALVALGMTILFRVTTIVNFAHGELFMFSAFIIYLLLNVFGVPYVVAALGAILALFLLGSVVERLLMRPIMQAPHMALAMMTVALSYMLRGVVRMVWGGDVRSLPPMFTFDPLMFGDVVLAAQDIVTIGATLVLVAVFFVLLQKSRLGKLAQAVTDSPRGGALIGLNVPAFYRTMWGVASAMAAIAGILVAPVTLLYPDMGAGVLVHAFAAMTLGGFGNLGGAVAGGLLMGVLEQLAGGYVSTAMVDITSYIIIIAVLLCRPAGLFGRVERVRV
ncbi:MAG TPA: branched-chain amino acid ABC transporter permease [Rhodopila sp.]|jgi:branched-chain amino acid transport system permease protein|nr:branched-chain amino acid ABC transporter permease [Rhodopila sp.]